MGLLITIVCSVLVFIAVTFSIVVVVHFTARTLVGFLAPQATGWLAVVFIFMVSGLISAFIINFVVVNHQPISSSVEHWGQMGDFFGGMLNPIFAFASFLALMYTIKQQSSEMQETREEARMSRQAQEAAVITASQQLRQQEFLEAFKGLESLFRARDLEAKSYYLERHEQGVSLQSILSRELGGLLQDEEEKATNANSEAPEGAQLIDVENISVSALRLRARIVSKLENSFSSSKNQLRQSARSYSIQSAYSLQAYKELIKVGDPLSSMDGLMDIYAQELAQNLLFSSLCHAGSVVYTPESINEICPRLSKATEILFGNLQLSPITDKQEANSGA